MLVNEIKKIKPTNTKCQKFQPLYSFLQLWHQFFSKTFQQYHRLSAGPVMSQDGVAALRLWQEYFLHVQSFLSGSIPEDYHSLTVHQYLCEV